MECHRLNQVAPIAAAMWMLNITQRLANIIFLIPTSKKDEKISPALHGKGSDKRLQSWSKAVLNGLLSVSVTV